MNFKYIILVLNQFASIQVILRPIKIKHIDTISSLILNNIIKSYDSKLHN